MSKMYWTEGNLQYQQAFAIDPTLSTDTRYLADLIKALESPSWYGKAETYLRAAGKAAIPLLQDAVAKNPAASVVHKRAAEVLAQLN
jgi:hypothetical protein